MDFRYLDLPARPDKPRHTGLTMAIDTGLPTGLFRDTLESFADHVDVVKFGWGTVAVTPDFAAKARCCAELGIGYYFGGTFLERHVLAERVGEYLRRCREAGCSHVEVSDGTIDMSAAEKAGYITAASAAGFVVLSEVGYKDPNRVLSPADWVTSIQRDLDAGASFVITETRESGHAGICTAEGTLRPDVLEAILDAVDPDKLIFEAPTKELQVELLRAIGPNVNLGNIAFADLVGLETLRLGLRSDTVLNFTVPVQPPAVV